MAPVPYLDSVGWEQFQPDPSDIPSNETFVPWLFSEDGLEAVVNGAFRPDGHDIVVTDVLGNLVPSELVFFSKATTEMQGALRDPAQDSISGGTDLYLQYGSPTINKANDPNVWKDGWGGSIDHIVDYPLNEIAGNAINFASPGTYDGSVDATYSATGKVRDGFSFDGTDEVRAANSGSLGFGGALTVKFLVSLPSLKMNVMA